MLAITGSTGLIGQAVVEALPFPQRRLIRPISHQQNSNESVSSVEVILGDLQHRETVEKFLVGTDTLIHLACHNNPRSPLQPIEKEMKEHLLPTTNLFESFARLCPHGHLIFASTGGNMYADGTPYIPRTEAEVAHPRSFYAIEKLTAEHCLRAFCEHYGIRATILRISNPYGVILSSKRAHGFIGIALSSLLSGETLQIIDPWETTRDYVHLHDLRSAFERVIQQPPKRGECRLYHVSSGVGHSLKEVITQLEALAGCSIPIVYRPQSSHVSWSVLSNEKIGRELDWKPRISFKEGLYQLWNHCQRTIEAIIS